MDWSVILDNKLLVAFASALGGAAVTLFTTSIVNRRGLFTYFVRHSRVGVSADDAVFGSVRVTWNGNLIANLYSSTIELINQSMKDYENVLVRVFTTDTSLLTERLKMVGSTQVPKRTAEFVAQIRVPDGQVATDGQRQLFTSQRDYSIATLNRGQVVRFTFLNNPRAQNSPSIWLDVLHKGVRLQFRVPRSEVLGVPQPSAALVGATLCLALIAVIVSVTDSVLLAGLWGLTLGFFAQLPGALAIKLWRFLREWLGG
jgi:hypothetical protein